MKYGLMIGCLLIAGSSSAQKFNRNIEKGNNEYRQKQYVHAVEHFQKALQQQPTNIVAQFNAGNAQLRLKKYEEAARSYESVASNATDALVKSQAWYNQGLAYIKQNKLPEAIAALKKSLRINPNDSDARDNLQKALKQLQQQQSQNKDPKQDKNKKTPKDKSQSKQDQPKLNKEEADKMLDQLSKEEKNLQKQVQKKNQSARQLKDW